MLAEKNEAIAAELMQTEAYIKELMERYQIK